MKMSKKTRKRWIRGLTVVLAALLLIVTGCGKKADQSGRQYESLEDLAERRIAVQAGTFFDTAVKEEFPNAQISSYPSYADMAAALQNDKADAVAGYKPVLQSVADQDSDLTVLGDSFNSYDFAFVFAKDAEGKALRDQVSAYIEEKEASGELKELQDIWMGSDESVKVVDDFNAYPDTKGTLVMASEGEYMPFDYYKDGKPVGYEIALAAGFCKENGYRLRIQSMAFSSILPAVQSHKVDFGCSGIAITEERKESLYFSRPSYSCGITFMVMKSELEKKSFFASVGESIDKTFVREGRYRLFLSGVGTTLLIGLLSLIFGTALGFLAYLWCRNGNRFANAITRLLVWIVQVMPAIVLLMILYYIVFGKVSISGMWVAVVGFTLTFAATVFGLIKSGVSSVGKGQAEASNALGFTERQTFFGIVLPQAVQRVMPAYKGAVISLIKSTSIVGYIAVKDLTKMGDYVRSRTYEAFFPLIAVAVVYFALATVLSLIVKKIGTRTDPRRRTKEQILKGVKTHD